MVGTIHDESDARRNHAEFTDNQFVTKEIIMVLNVLFKVRHILEIIIIGIVAHLNIRVSNDVFQETKHCRNAQGEISRLCLVSACVNSQMLQL